jgi:hypothetical protein
MSQVVFCMTGGILELLGLKTTIVQGSRGSNGATRRNQCFSRGAADGGGATSKGATGVITDMNAS